MGVTGGLEACRRLWRPCRSHPPREDPDPKGRALGQDSPGALLRHRRGPRSPTVPAGGPSATGEEKVACALPLAGQCQGGSAAGGWRGAQAGRAAAPISCAVCGIFTASSGHLPRGPARQRQGLCSKWWPQQTAHAAVTRCRCQSIPQAARPCHRQPARAHYGTEEREFAARVTRGLSPASCFAALRLSRPHALEPGTHSTGGPRPALAGAWEHSRFWEGRRTTVPCPFDSPPSALPQPPGESAPPPRLLHTHRSAHPTACRVSHSCSLPRWEGSSTKANIPVL